MKMLAVQYICTEAFCIFILILLLRNFIENSGLQATSRMYVRMIMCNVVYFASDICYVACEDKLINAPLWFFYIVNVVYFAASATAGIFWLRYAGEEQKNPWFYKKRNYYPTFIPLVLFTLLSLTSHWTHLIFYIDENGSYHRGTLFWLEYVIPFGYIAAASVMLLVRASRKDNPLSRRTSNQMAAFIFPPVICSAIQTINDDLPTLTMGITIILLALYIGRQNTQISVDPLTQVNNRFQITRYLSNKVAAYDGKKELFLFMIDLNLFKRINDTYGHVEGDAALVRTAGVLKKVCAGKDYFIGRYGGDEFILIGDMGGDDEAEELCAEIHRNIKAANEAAGTEYKISLSIGSAKYKKEYMDMTAFIAAADEELYKVKKARKIDIR